ncbi:hypothetical protein BH11MYX1_BH11MYX1_25420 [soil metagenome]
MWRLMLFATACGSTAGVVETPANRAAVVAVRPPDLAELRSLIGDVPFSANSVANRGCTSAPTLGGYVALLVEEGSPSADGHPHALTGGCGEFPEQRLSIDPPASPAWWFCRIDARVVAEDPWHYELHVRVRKVDRVVDTATAACPGV